MSLLSLNNNSFITGVFDLVFARQGNKIEIFARSGNKIEIFARQGNKKEIFARQGGTKIEIFASFLVLYKR